MLKEMPVSLLSAFLKYIVDNFTAKLDLTFNKAKLRPLNIAFGQSSSSSCKQATLFAALSSFRDK
jgi:hypothetical protein